MAEVKRACRSSSLSSKHIYDDVFASPPPKFKSSNLSSFVDDDYAEIFGCCSKSVNGGSIPILDLPVVSEERLRGRVEVDYSGVFGDEQKFNVPDGEQLFGQYNKKAKTSLSPTTPRSKEQTTESTRPELSGESHNGRSPTNGFLQSFDSVKHMELKNNETITNGTSGPRHVAHVDVIPGSTYSLHEVGPSSESQTSRSPLIKDDTELAMDVNVAKKQVSDSRNTRAELGANKQNSECDAGYQKASGLSGSNSVDTSNDACQESTVAGSSKAVKDDVKVVTGFNMVKNKERHSRMTSLDLGYHKHACERDAKHQRKSRSGGSYSFDASHDPCASRVQVQPSKTVPSSSLPRFFPMESHLKVSENSSCKSSENNLYTGGGGSPPSLDEQLDVNSDAAVSAAALQRALEEAEMQIRLAKEFLQREGQGSTKLSFKDTLKANVVQDNKHVNKIEEFRQNRVRENRPRVERAMQSSPPLEIKSVPETVELNPVFEDQKKFIKEEEPIEVESSKPLRSIKEGDKHAGGEWEAAKHLNQLITGVKNRLASFMVWQVETEKKEEPKEVEASTKSLQQSEESEPELKTVDVFEVKETEENQHATTCVGEAALWKSQRGLLPEAVDLEENEVKSNPVEQENEFTRSNTMEQENEFTKSNPEEHEKAGDGEDLAPGSEGPTTANFLCFTFRSDRVTDLPDQKEEKKKEAQESRELEIDNKQEQVVNEKDEFIEGKREEVNQEGSDDTCERQDCKVSLMHSRNEENEEMVEGPSIDGNDRKEFTHEDTNIRLDEGCKEEPTENSYRPDSNEERIVKDDDREVCDVLKEAEEQQENIQILEGRNLVGEIAEGAEVTMGVSRWQENKGCRGQSNHFEEVDGQMYGLEENERNRGQTNHSEETAKEVAEQRSCTIADDEHEQIENVVLSKAEEDCQTDGSNQVLEEAAFPDEESERMMEITNCSSEPKMEMEMEIPVFLDEEIEKMEINNPSAEPKMENPGFAQKANELIGEKTVQTSVSTEKTMEFNGIKEDIDDPTGTLQCQSSVLHESDTDMSCGQKDTDEEMMECKPEVILENQTDYFNESGETLNVGDTVSDQDGEKCSVEAGHRRRRWFENGEKVGGAELPSFHEVDKMSLDVDPDVVEESELAGSVEIHVDKLGSETKEDRTTREADSALNQENGGVNVEKTPKRRRWFVKRGEEGAPELRSLFEGIKGTLEMNHDNENELLQQNITDNCLDNLNTEAGDAMNMEEANVALNEEKERQSFEAVPRRKRWFESGEKVGPAQQLRINEDVGMTVEIKQEQKAGGNIEKCGKPGNMPILEEQDDVHCKLESVNELHRDLEEVNRREKEKEKEKIAVERAIREARERAFAEARERAKRDAMERPTTEARKRVAAGAHDKAGKVSSESNSSTDRAAMEAKLRAERAAVERATAEARERALQKALSDKASNRAREAGRYPAEKSSSSDPKYQSSSSYSRCSDSSSKDEKNDGADGESAQRRKARLERQRRTMERADKALEEKNKRDLLVQKEQAAKNMFADALDAEVKRWSSGKEGNLRALLSTLQYILGPDSGWQAVSLTDLVAATAVRKAYKKANLCVHPDKLQQRGATIQQKYICEKVFDLLKDAWSKFNPDER